MTIVLAGWMIPTAITLAIIAWAIFLPLPANRGDYDFSREATGVFRLAIAVFATLVVWLAYFAVT